MLTLMIIFMILAVVFIVVTGFCVILLDPLIALLVIVGIYKLVKKLFFSKKK